MAWCCVYCFAFLPIMTGVPKGRLLKQPERSKRTGGGKGYVDPKRGSRTQDGVASASYGWGVSQSDREAYKRWKYGRREPRDIARRTRRTLKHETLCGAFQTDVSRGKRAIISGARQARESQRRTQAGGQPRHVRRNHAGVWPQFSSALPCHGRAPCPFWTPPVEGEWGVGKSISVVVQRRSPSVPAPS